MTDTKDPTAGARQQTLDRSTLRKKGLLMVHTGKGKGKTTAALGLVFRAWGQGKRVCVIQFIKAETGNWGEVKAARKLGIDWFKSGDGFTWLSKDLEESAALARHGWATAQEKITSGDYDLVVLDEFTYPMHYGWLAVEDVVDWITEHKPEDLHLVITGRYAAPELVEAADLVTDMTKVKHPMDAGIKAQAGIEY